MADTRGPLSYRAFIDGKSLPVTDHVDARFSKAHMGNGACSMTFPRDTAALDDLLTNRVRLTITHSSGRQWWSGRLANRTVRPVGDGLVAVDFTHDLNYLRQINAWPAPAASINAQPAAWRMTGPAETVVKSIIGQNLTRLGVPYTIRADQKRGKQVKVEARFVPVWDAIEAACAEAGIGIDMQRHPTSGQLIIDCYRPSDDVFPVPMPIAAGVVEELALIESAPEATRLVVGGYGEGDQRALLEVINSPAEAEWGEPVETFVDMPAPTASTTGDDMYLFGLQQLLAKAARKSLPISLGENETFRFGVPGGINLGTTITVRALGVSVTDIITEVSVTDSVTDGINASMRLGAPESTDPDVRIARQIAAMQAELSRLRAR